LIFQREQSRDSSQLEICLRINSSAAIVVEAEEAVVAATPAGETVVAVAAEEGARPVARMGVVAVTASETFHVRRPDSCGMDFSTR